MTSKKATIITSRNLENFRYLATTLVKSSSSRLYARRIGEAEAEVRELYPIAQKLAAVNSEAFGAYLQAAQELGRSARYESRV
ncbi:MAG: hypothetical protein IK077_15460 [Thermoguttaceae bacterium]|nr:hypothetical protein [Thermoguttaceae bacterium]